MDAKTSEKKQDRRPAKTRAALGQALFALMQTSEWNDITIQGICDGANVARSSFYAHFATISDLLESLISENFPRFSGRENPASPIATIEWLVDHISENRQLFSKLNSSTSATLVLTGFKARAKASLRAELSNATSGPTDLQLDFIIGGVFESIHVWAKTWKTQQIPVLKIELDKFAKLILGQIS